MLNGSENQVALHTTKHTQRKTIPHKKYVFSFSVFYLLCIIESGVKDECPAVILDFQYILNKYILNKYKQDSSLNKQDYSQWLAEVTTSQITARCITTSSPVPLLCMISDWYSFNMNMCLEILEEKNESDNLYQLVMCIVHLS